MTRQVKKFQTKLPNQYGTPSIVKSDSKNISRDETSIKTMYRIVYRTYNEINKN